jgi:signal transduction histidine kinase
VNPVKFVSRSLRLKVSLGVGLVLILLLAPFNWLEYHWQRRVAIADLSQLAATSGAVAEHSLEGAMLSNSRPAIQTIIDSVAQAPDVRAVYLLNTKAVVAASPSGKFNGQQLDQLSGVCRGCHQFPPESRPLSVVETGAGGEQVFRTMTPIKNRSACEGCHAAQDRLNGVLYVDFSMAGLDERLERGLRAGFLASAAIIVLAGLAIYALLSWLVITPMEQVARALHRFGQGERAARALVRSEDEVGMLGGGFNEMAGTIQAQEVCAEQLYAELEARDAVRRQLLGRLTTAHEEERRYLARELHDELGQLLTGLSLHLKLARQACRDDMAKATDHLKRASALIGETIEESHRLITDLRPPVLDDYGLIPALREELKHRLTPVGVAVELDAGGQPAALPPEIATAAFRITQEAITNVIRHANAGQVNVAVQQTATGLTLTIDDDGVGLPYEEPARLPDGQGALGILGMQERADALGGCLEVTRLSPCGTRVKLWLPLDGGAR